ncbi:MAG: ComF family protein, partial [Flavobacteriaceae bacterium]|nr:ComF family protein [Flavobacteriaceae bacterium]
MQFYKDLFNLFFPRTCTCCDEQLVRNEQVICLKCRFDLPLTNFTDEKNNSAEQIFFGRVK